MRGTSMTEGEGLRLPVRKTALSKPAPSPSLGLTPSLDLSPIGER